MRDAPVKPYVPGTVQPERGHKINIRKITRDSAYQQRLLPQFLPR